MELADDVGHDLETQPKLGWVRSGLKRRLGLAVAGGLLGLGRLRRLQGFGGGGAAAGRLDAVLGLR